MAYREVTVIEIEEVLRQWIAGVPIKRIAGRVGLDCVFRRIRTPIPAQSGRSFRAGRTPSERGDAGREFYLEFFSSSFKGDRIFRIDSPSSLMRWALWTRRSQMESAAVSSPMTACH